MTECSALLYAPVPLAKTIMPDSWISLLLTGTFLQHKSTPPDIAAPCINVHKYLKQEQETAVRYRSLISTPGHSYKYPFKYIIIIDQYGRKSALIPFIASHSPTELISPPFLLTHSSKLHNSMTWSNIPIITCPTSPPGTPTSDNPPSPLSPATEPAKTEPPATKANDSGESQKKRKKKKKGVELTIDPVISPAGNRRLARRLSHDSLSVKSLLQEGGQLINNCKTRRLSLDKKHIRKVQVIANQGHRVTIIVDYQNGESTCRFVLKMTDESYLDLKRFYEQDITLITYKQAVMDVMALLDFKEHFLQTRITLAHQVYFAETRLVIVFIQEFLDLLLTAKPLGQFTNVMIPLLQQAASEENACMFLLMQEYVNVDKISDEELALYRDLIDYLKERIHDVDATGRNLLVDRNKNKLVILDVELNQLDWTYHSELEKMDSARSATPVSPVSKKALQEFDFLVYKDISSGSQVGICHSLSINPEHSEQRDSGVGVSSSQEGEQGSLSTDFLHLDIDEDEPDDNVFD